MGLIYAWIDENGTPFYVGKCKNLNKRNIDHRIKLKNGDHTYKYNKLRKLLRNGFAWIVNLLEIDVPDGLLNDREIYWISKFRNEGIKLCNLTEGGEGCDTFANLTEEQKKLLREKKRELATNWWNSPGTKEKLSQIHKNTWESASELQKEQWAATKRKPRSAEARKHMSEARKGIEFSEEHKKNLSIARRKRITTDETRRKMSESSKGIINIKRFRVTSPDGQVFITEQGLTLFCEEHHLQHTLMAKVADGERQHHKGWKCERL